MKTISLSLTLFVFAPAFALGCACSTTLADTHASGAAVVQTKEAARHALKGVVVEIMAERSALLVKHEEIPGVMAAMTMLLKVDEAGLKAAKKGDAITGMLVRKTDGWWLEDVKAAAAPAGGAHAES